MYRRDTVSPIAGLLGSSLLRHAGEPLANQEYYDVSANATEERAPLVANDGNDMASAPTTPFWYPASALPTRRRIARGRAVDVASRDERQLGNQFFRSRKCLMCRDRYYFSRGHTVGLDGRGCGD